MAKARLSAERASSQIAALQSKLRRQSKVAARNARLCREAREANLAKDRFVATLAHELRNPLAPMRHAIEIMQLRGMLDESLEQARLVIDRQIKHMVRLLDDLLDVSRIEMGKVQLHYECVDLAAVMKQAAETCRHRMEAREHTLAVALPGQALCLWADAARLEQVFQNLLNNAARYTAPGGRIEMSAEREGELVSIRVRDNGSGLPPNMLERIFDPFVQLKPSREHCDAGLGIGLSLVRHLVTLHGGTVWAESRGEGHGSEFVVMLPIPHVTQPQPAEPSLVRCNTSRRVLLIEDSLDVQRTLGELLQCLGHSVSAAETGPEGLRKALDERPEIALVDIDLPGLDGYAIARTIREQIGARGMYLVALTGYGQAEDKRRALEAGFDVHLVKPVEIEELERVLAVAPRRPEEDERLSATDTGVGAAVGAPAGAIADA